MKSNYSAARAHIERAYDHLQGSDNTSAEARHALDLLIEALVIADFRKPRGKVVEFLNSRKGGVNYSRQS